MKKIIIILLSLIILNSPIITFAQPDLLSSSALLITNDGQVLYAKNANERIFPANTTKILTAILILEQCALDEFVIIPNEATQVVGTKINLKPGEIYQVKELLAYMFHNSANDAAISLAIHHSGSEDNFVNSMNTKAKELGALHSHFQNSYGLHDIQHYTTIIDLNIITKYAMTIPNFRECIIKQSIINNENKILKKIYQLPNQYPFYTEIFSDETTIAQNILITSFKKNDIDVYAFISNAPNKNLHKDAKILFDYGFNTLKIKDQILKDSAQKTNLRILIAFSIVLFSILLGKSSYKVFHDTNFPNRIYLLSLYLIIYLLLSSSVFFVPVYAYKEKFLPGIVVEDISLENLTKQEAIENLNKYFNSSIKLTYKNQYFIFNLTELGISIDLKNTIENAFLYSQQRNILERWSALMKLNKDTISIPITYNVDYEKMKNTLVEQVYKKINQSPINAYYRLEENQIIILPDIGGVEANIDQLKNLLINWQNNTSRTFSVPVMPIVAKFTKVDLEPIKPTKLLASYTTEFVDNPNRTENIRLSSKSIHGYFLEPGSIFSFNEVVGPREKARGYKVAFIISNGKFIPGLGGGVCQVSSTLYNTCLEANLEIIERHPHSLPISYVPKGKDAAVYYPTGDFKFKNNTNGYLLITTNIIDRNLTIKIYGS